MSPDDVEQVQYKPVFPELIPSLKAYVGSKIKDMKFGTSVSVTEMPYLSIEGIRSRIAKNEAGYYHRQGLYFEASLMLTMYVEEKDIPKYYDMIINVLHGWASYAGLLDLKIEDRSLRCVKEEVDHYVISLDVVVGYQDYVADTTYPLVSEAECEICVDLTGVPKTIRVEKVQVIADTTV